MKPNFLIIGTAKAGTTSLWDLLRQHPGVYMCRKEPCFFSHDEFYARGWAWYESLFTDAGSAKVIGDVSPAYSLFIRYPRAVERIAKHLPEARLVYVVRHPLTLMESVFQQSLHTGYSVHPMPRTFAKAVKGQYPPFIEFALYWQSLNRFREYFPDEKISVLFFEDFKSDPDGFLAGLFRFLGIDDSFRSPDADRPRNPSSGHDMDSFLLNLLRKIPGLRTMSRMLPGGLRSRARSGLRVPVPDRPEWDPDTRQWVLERVVDDAKAILEYGGKPADFWKLDEV